MDFQVAGAQGTTTVFSTHRAGPTDTSPLQMISAERLAYYDALERALQAFVGSVEPLLQLGPGAAVEGHPSVRW